MTDYSAAGTSLTAAAVVEWFEKTNWISLDGNGCRRIGRGDELDFLSRFSVSTGAIPRDLALCGSVNRHANPPSMKRPKTRVLIESAADATKAARALLACLRGIDVEAFETLLVEHESLAGVPADGRSRDDFLPRLEEAIGKALPAGYYLSYEKVR